MAWHFLYILASTPDRIFSLKEVLVSLKFHVVSPETVLVFQGNFDLFQVKQFEEFRNQIILTCTSVFHLYPLKGVI
jgi:hypothetical protein